MTTPAISDVISRLQSLTKYDVSIAGGCECCGSWLDKEEDKDGEWVRSEDIQALINEFQGTTK